MAYSKRWPRYVPVGEKKKKAEKKLKKLKKKHSHIQPVTINGQALANTWWGKAWNKNLKRYADYSNRIGRGRSYVRHGAVLDLSMDKGRIKAMVQGSVSTPYEVVIKIKKLPQKKWRAIKAGCKGRLDSLHELLEGKFPKALSEIFMAKGSGLFPAPNEISLSCDCPDWADMCKHVAAALYGAGVRLDEKPALFFTLRNIDMEGLKPETVKEKTGELLEKAGKKTGRVIDDSDLGGLFGIDMEGPLKPDAPSGKRVKKALKASPGKKSKQKPAARTPGATEAPGGGSAIDAVFSVIKKNKKGTNMAGLRKETGFEDRKIYNVIYRLKKQKKVKSIARGLYVETK